MTEWTFLTKHALVLSLLTRNQQVTAAELAKAVGVTERTVRRVIAELAQCGYISKEREGKRVRYHINPALPLSDKLFREIPVGDFLEALGWKTRDKDTQRELMTERKLKPNRVR